MSSKLNNHASQTDGGLLVVTGVGHGLGRALATQFLALGHPVTGCTLGQAEVDQLTTEHPRGHWQRVDVTDGAAVASWADSVIARHGPPRLLVCCAGLIHPSAPLWELDADRATDVLRVNLEGPLLTLRAWLPAMNRQGRGTAVVISSGMATTRPAGFAPYTASKCGVEGLVGSVAHDVAEGVSVVALHPGLIRTRMLETVLSPSEVEVYPPPEVWAESAAPFLLSLGPASNGQVLPLPGWG